MADLVLSASLGPAGRNSGRPRYADVVASLYVGGSGMWQFNHLGAPRRREPASSPVRILSAGVISTELAAGFAIATGLDGALTRVEHHLGMPWTGQELDLDRSTLGELASLAFDLDVAVLVTLLAPDETQTNDLLEMPWSVVVATPTAESRNTQWD